MTEPSYTVEQLLAMDGDAFHAAVTSDLKSNGRPDSPFQAPEVADRTYSALLEQLWTTDAVIQRQAEDPDVTPERYARTRAFRHHLIGTLDRTERTISRRSRNAEAVWRKLLNDVLDEIEGGPDDDLLDDLQIPFPGRRGTDEKALTLRQWLEVRRIKDPSRVPVKEMGVAA